MDTNYRDDKALEINYLGFRVTRISEDESEIEIKGPFNTYGTGVNISVIEKS